MSTDCEPYATSVPRFIPEFYANFWISEKCRLDFQSETFTLPKFLNCLPKNKKLQIHLEFNKRDGSLRNLLSHPHWV